MGLGAIIVFLGGLAVALVVAARRARRRASAFRLFAASAGLRVPDDRAVARDGLAGLPGLPGPGRLVFGAIARSDNEIVADVSVTRPPKEVRRDRHATLMALRRRGEGLPVGVARAPEIADHEDPSPTGFGWLRVADDGEWVVCRTIGRRVPDERLAEFRDRAHQLVSPRLAASDDD